MLCSSTVQGLFPLIYFANITILHVHVFHLLKYVVVIQFNIISHRKQKILSLL